MARLEGELNGRRDDALLVAPQGLIDGPVRALERDERKVALFLGLDSAADAEGGLVLRRVGEGVRGQFEWRKEERRERGDGRGRCEQPKAEGQPPRSARLE